ncbi:hypothetical protein VUR80DRAFT_5980 [Thermomyces stellatus]
MLPTCRHDRKIWRHIWNAPAAIYHTTARPDRKGWKVPAYGCRYAMDSCTKVLSVLFPIGGASYLKSYTKSLGPRSFIRDPRSPRFPTSARTVRTILRCAHTEVQGLTSTSPFPTCLWASGPTLRGSRPRSSLKPSSPLWQCSNHPAWSGRCSVRSTASRHCAMCCCYDKCRPEAPWTPPARAMACRIWNSTKRAYAGDDAHCFPGPHTYGQRDLGGAEAARVCPIHRTWFPVSTGTRFDTRTSQVGR